MVYDSIFDSILDSFWNNSFEDVFSNWKAPHVVKSVCESSFPTSNIEINKLTKQFKITVCLPGLSEKDVRLDREDNVLKLTFNKETEKDDNWKTLQNGFKNISEKAELSWKIDTTKYDLDTVDVKLENGLMTIVVEPTEAAKPKRIAGVFGALEDKKEEQ